MYLYIYIILYKLYLYLAGKNALLSRGRGRTRETSSSSSAAALGDAREIDEQGAVVTAAAGARAKEKATLAHTELAFARRRKNGLLRS